MPNKAESKSADALPESPRDWFVRMSNGSVFGPINTKGLVHWACDGRIMPDDEISCDRINWRAARELETLGMDTMIERPDGTFMGPFNRKAIDPLAREGKIPPQSKRFPIDELEARMASRQMALFGDEALDADSTPTTVVDSVGERDRDLAQMRVGYEEQIEAIQQAAQDKFAEYERQIETLEAECIGLQEKLTAVDKQTQKDDAWSAENQALRQQLVEAEGVLKASHEATAEREAETTKLQAHIVELTGLLAAAEQAQASVRTQCDEWEARLQSERAAAEVASRGRVETQTAADDEIAGLRRQLDEARQANEALQAEFNELLVFSNARDGEAAEQGKRLESELEVLRKQAGVQGLAPQRRLEEQETRLREVMQERDVLKDKLAESGARVAIAERSTEGDIAIVKMFAEGAVEMMRKTLEQERARNTAVRAASAEMQGMIHAEIERLERVLARDPGELSRSEQVEQRTGRQVAQIQQELDSSRRHHQADMARAEANEKALEGRCKALVQKETLLREKLSRVEQRTADYDSLTNQLRRKESALLAAEKEFEEARQQWQIIEATLQHRIDELENGAGLLFDANGQSKPQEPSLTKITDNKGFRVEPWMRRMKRK